MARFVILCLAVALVACVIAAPGRERRFFDGGHNLGGYGGGFGGYGGHGGGGHGGFGGHGFGGIVPHSNTQSFSKSSASSSSVSGGVALG